MGRYTLFELVDEMQELYDMATDPDTDPETLEGSIESVMGAIEVKSCAYANLIKQLEMEQNQAEMVSKAFADKARVRKNNVKRLKEALMIAMDKLDMTALPAGAFTFKIAKNGGLQPLKIDGEVPQNMTKVIVEPDNDKIREFLKDNECEWAHLEERGRHIVIK
jgi:hypothetical protein